MRYVTLGNGRKVSLGSYVAAWRRCLSMNAAFQVACCPDGYSGSAADALEQFRDGMHDRINKHLPNYGRGRKWSNDWQRETLQAAYRLNTPRLIIDWLPRHLADRFADRLRCNAY